MRSSIRYLSIANAKAYPKVGPHATHVCIWRHLQLIHAVCPDLETFVVGPLRERQEVMGWSSPHQFVGMAKEVFERGVEVVEREQAVLTVRHRMLREGTLDRAGEPSVIGL